MTDFESSKHGGFDRDNAAYDASENISNLYQDAEASSSSARQILQPNAEGIVLLPEGVTLNDIAVEGRDLVINLADGSVIVIPDGAIIVPQLVIEGIAVPPSTLAALLNDAELNPEAGGDAQTPSSGGNFAGDEGAIQDAFDLGNLLPYTELGLAAEEEEEILPFEDAEPEIVIETPDNDIGVTNAIARVDEAGLPERGEEPEGTEEPTDIESTSGTFVITSPDGIGALILNGVEITQPGQEIVTDLGILTITGVDFDTGEVTFDYLLTDNTFGDDTVDVFEAVVRDLDGDEGTATLTVIIEDDEPIGNPDEATIPGGQYGPVEGNVIDNDISGADDFPEGPVTGISFGGTTALPGESIEGDYGVLTINDDGTYSYTRNPDTPGGVQDIFTYTIEDQDGSPAEATLTINIGNLPPEITFIPSSGAGTEVFEEGLPARGDESEGSNEPSDGEITSGTITFESPDGVSEITIAGVVITPDALPQTVSDDATGTLVITGYSFDADTGIGSITYEYTLIDNTDGDDTPLEFPIVVADLDGQSDDGTLTIIVRDDEPEANADTDSVTEGSAPQATGNVLTDEETNGDDGADVQGADGASVTGVVVGAVTGPVEGQVGTDIAGLYGTLTVAADGSYTYTLDETNPTVVGLDGTQSLNDEVFTYTITDGDGDQSTTTITITVNGQDDPVVISGLLDGADEVVDEDDLDDGSSPDADALTQGGTFTVDSPDGLATLTVGGETIFGGGVTYPVEIAGDYGTVRITGVTVTTDADGDVVSAEVAYEYVLSTNTLDHPDSGEDDLRDSFEVVATDTDGSPDTASLDIDVIDDVPTANPDEDSVTEDGPLTADGNVLTGTGGADANDTDGAADVEGADSASVTGVAAGDVGADVDGNVGSAVAGTYGSISIDANGDYVYTLDNDNPAVQGLDSNETLTEVFTYTITDGDTDTSTTTITVVINGQDDPVVINGLDGEGAEETVDEDDLDNGTSPDEPALTQGGTFSVDSPDGLTSLTVGGVEIFDGVTYPIEIEGEYGTIRITGVTPTTDGDGDVTSVEVAYEYVLDENTLDHSDGELEDALTDDFEVIATDSDGSTASDFVNVDVIDDIPDATDNTNTVSEGGETGGNVLTDDDGDGVDVAGADGYAQGGAIVGITSVNEGTSDSEANGDGDFVLEGQYGTLTLNTDGTYTYVANPNVVNADETDTFTYTIRDGDGDESTAELVITVTNVAGDVSDNDVLVNEAGLPDGTGELADGDADNNSDDSETFATGQITVTNATGPFVYILESDADGTYGTLTLNADGSYSYTLDTAFDHDPDAPGADTNTANGVESFSYRVEDTNGNVIGSGEIVVSVIDDIPQVDIALGQGAPMALETQDADTIGNASDTDSADFSGAFSIVESLYGADGAGTLETTYALALAVAEGTDSGLNSDGADIFLYQRDDGTIVGSTSNTEPATDDASVIFTLSVDGNGSVTLTQFAEVDHSDSDTGAPYDGDVEALASGLVDLVATATITDSDGDVVSDDQALDLGGLVTFADDGPAIDANASEDGAPVLETQDADTEGAASDTDVSTANFGGAFTIASSDFGADGAGSTEWAFSLEVANSDSLLSSGGQAINLFLIGGVVVGSTAANAGDVTEGNTVFDVAVDSDGVVTLTQYAEIDHDGPGMNDGDFDSQLAVLADGRINLVGEATVTDEEGDSASDTVTLDLGGNIAFADDGPVAIADTNALTEDDADVSGNVLTDGVDDDFGADGAADTTPAGGVVGVEAGDDTSAAVSGNLGSAVQGDFGELTLNADGTYTYDLDNSLVQGLDDGESETDTFVYTIEDGDGDTSTVTLTITINGSNDAPEALADTNWTVEDAGGPITGNVLADVAHNGAPDNVDRGDVADTDVDGEVLSVTTTGTFNGTYGVLTLNADGSYSYRLYTEQENQSAYDTVQALGDGEGPLNDIFNYTASDGTTGDASTLTIAIFGTNDAPTAVAGVAAVSDEGLADANPDNAGTPSDTTDSAVFLTGDLQIADTDTNDTLDVTLGIPSETISIVDGGSGTALTWAVVDGGNTLVGYVSDVNDPSVIVSASDDGTYTVEILDPIYHDETGVEDVEGFVVPVTVSDGTTSTPTTISVSLEDDSPVLTAPIADTSTSNDPDAPIVVGDLNFAAGADGPSANVTITVDTTGMTVGGEALTTVQDGNVLTAFVDADNSGTFNDGDTAAFTVTVDPTAGTSGEYEFDLITPLDGETTLIDLLSDGAYGVGPSLSVLVSQDSTGDELVFVTGWEPNGNGGQFTGGELTDWLGGGNPDLTQVPGVNGSTAGFGVDNNNFDAGEFLRFDFGPLDDYDGAGGYNPPGGTNLLDATFATFTMSNFGNGDVTHFVAHFSDGTTQEYTFTGSGGGNGSATLNIVAPPGTTIAYVDAYQESGSVKLNLSDLGVTDTNVDIDIPVTIELTDQDGDPVSDSFVININEETPNAQDDLTDAPTEDADLNIAFVVDFSSSINAFELDQELTAVREAAIDLFGRTSGTVSVTLVGFDTDAINFGTFTDLAQFEALIDSINPADGGTRPLTFGTSYTDGLDALMNGTSGIDGWPDASGWDPDAGDINQVFFISDGRASRDRGTDDYPLSDAVRAEWEAYVAANDFEITAIAVGDNQIISNLEAVDIDGNGSPILIGDFSGLVGELITQILVPVSGNVLDNDIAPSNGISLVSITVDGAVYSFDGTDITAPGGGTIAGSSFTAATAMGGEITFDFATGDWTYVPSQDSPTGMENFQYTIVDGDGDTDTAILRIDLDAIGSTNGGEAEPEAQTMLVSKDESDPVMEAPAKLADDQLSGDNDYGKGAQLANDNELIGARGVAAGQIAAAGLGFTMVNFGEMGFDAGNTSFTFADAMLAGSMQGGATSPSATSFAGLTDIVSDVWSGASVDGIAASLDANLIGGDSYQMPSFSDFAADLGSEASVELASGIDAPIATFDGGATPSVLAVDGSAGMMEALLSLEGGNAAAGNVAEASGLANGDLPDVAAILSDVMAQGAVDAMIDTLTGHAGDSVPMDTAARTIGEASLTQTVDGSAFAFDATQMADMSVEAAAVAASVG